MMDGSDPHGSHNGETKGNTKKGAFAIIISMVLIGAIFMIFLSYQFLVATQTDAPVLEVEVSVRETGGQTHITGITTTQSRMELLESPRIDDKGIIPGVRVKLFRGQKVLSYDSFVEYSGSGTYDLVCGFKETPEDGDTMTCTVWVFSGEGASFADDQESTELVWGDVQIGYGIVAKVTITGTLPDTGGDANITQVEASQAQYSGIHVNQGCFFPGVYAYAMRFSTQVSYMACVNYEGGGNYTLNINLKEKPNPGDELTVRVDMWHRNGQWMEGYYSPPIDSFTTTLVWS